MADYIILYAPSGQTGETVFKLATRPLVNTNGATNVQWAWVNGLLQLNYNLQGTAFVKIVSGNTSLSVLIFTKEIANTWHAPLINGNGPFSNFYSIGTNET